jgi:hypothetical protein
MIAVLIAVIVALAASSLMWGLAALLFLCFLEDLFKSLK